MTTSPDLAAWIETQLSAVEQRARDAADGSPGVWEHPCTHEGMEQKPPSHDTCANIDCYEIRIYDEGGHSAEQAIHIAANDPATVLRDVAAKRKLLGLHRLPHECVAQHDESPYRDGWHAVGDANVCPTLQALAEGLGWSG